MTSFHLYGNNTCYPTVIQLNVDGKREGRGGKRPRFGSYPEEDIISVDKPSGNQAPLSVFSLYFVFICPTFYLFI